MVKPIRPLVWAGAMLLLGGCASGPIAAEGFEAPASPITQAVDDWHRAAATGDLEQYQSLMTDDVVFLGTDKTERWVGDEFIAFCRPYFNGPTEYGLGTWTYEPVERHVSFSDDGRTAWFDESLVNQSYGNCRGTGVLVRGDDDLWRIAHYSLTFPVPNEIAKSVVEQIKAQEARDPTGLMETPGE